MKKPGSKSQWQTEELAKAFLQGIRGAIPGADLQMEVMGKIVAQWKPQPLALLDVGCGDGLLGRLLLKKFPAAQVTFTDFSEPMLAAVRDKLGDPSRATIFQADFSKSSWLKTVAEKGPFDVVVSGFAIHHQPNYRKKKIYAGIHEILTPGGVFLNLEHVASVSDSVEKLFDDLFIDHLLRFHRVAKPDTTRQEIEATYYYRPDKKENILAPIEVQCAWLRQIGFQDVDCFFKIFELALFGGRKASSQKGRPRPWQGLGV